MDIEKMTPRRPYMLRAFYDWLVDNDLPALEVTNQRDFDLIQIWDDRAVQVAVNTGEVLTPKEHISLDLSGGWIGVELDGTLAHFENKLLAYHCSNALHGYF